MADDPMTAAALAFDAAISPAAKPAARGRSEDAPIEGSLFGNLGALEVDDESPASGGGDDINPDEVLYGKSGKRPERDSGEGDGRRKPKDDEDDDADDANGDADAEDDPDADPDEEAETDEEEDPEEAAVLAREVEVTVDGEPVTVTIKEALEGYIRTQTFHQRLNQVEDAKKIVRKAAADAVTNYEFSQTLAQQMQTWMDEMIPKEPDWDAEFAKDPVAARQLQQFHEKVKNFRGQLKTQTDEAAEKARRSQHTQLMAFAEEESHKFDAANRKNWSDPKKKAKDLASMRKTGLATGFTEEELSQVYDSRMLTVLLKASKYDRMMAAKPKPVIRDKKPIPPGAGSARTRTAQNGDSSAMKRLSRTGSVRDAAVVFDSIVRREG